MHRKTKKQNDFKNTKLRNIQLRIIDFGLYKGYDEIMKRIGRIFTLILFINLLSSVSWAQIDTSGIAVPIPINPEQKFSNGDVICLSDGKYSLCEGEYDSEIFGVVTLNPAAAFEYEEKEGTVPVQSSGIALTKVTNIDGDI